MAINNSIIHSYAPNAGAPSFNFYQSPNINTFFLLATETLGNKKVPINSGHFLAYGRLHNPVDT